MIFQWLRKLYVDKSDPNFLGYAVDPDDHYLKEIKSFNDNGDAVLGEKIKRDELPINTDSYPYGDWQTKVLTHDFTRTTIIFAILFPFFFAVYLITILTFFPRPMLASPMVTTMVVITYLILTKTSTQYANIIAKHPSGDKYMLEERWWNSDHRAFPEETKISRMAVRGKGDSLELVETGERFIWLDCRGEYVKQFHLEESDATDSDITPASIIGVESLKASAFNFARLRGNASALERNLPYIGILIVSLIGTFFASNKILAIMGLDG